MFDKNQGQIMIIILLVMVVSLTIGLSFASRQLTNIRLTSQTEQSQKAFSAAEAGIEDALRRDLWELTNNTSGAANLNSSAGQAQYQVNIARTDFAGTNEFVSESAIRRDDVTQVITKGLDNKGLEIYWGPGSDDNDANSGAGSCGTTPNLFKCVASLEIIEVYKDIAGVWKINRYTYNPSPNNAHPSASLNGFNLTATTCSCNIGGSVFTESSGVITLNQGTELVRIKPIYFSSIIGVKSTSAGVNLPVQSVTISSTGSIGGISRKIEVTRSFDILPSVFDFAVYSGGDGGEPLTK